MVALNHLTWYRWNLCKNALYTHGGLSRYLSPVTCTSKRVKAAGKRAGWRTPEMSLSSSLFSISHTCVQKFLTTEKAHQKHPDQEKGKRRRRESTWAPIPALPWPAVCSSQPFAPPGEDYISQPLLQLVWGHEAESWPMETEQKAQKPPLPGLAFLNILSDPLPSLFPSMVTLGTICSKW